MNKSSILCMLVVVSLLLVAMVGCGSKAQTTEDTVQTLTSTEVKSFSKFGFTFEYPKNFSIWVDKLLDEEADENSGIVQVAPAAKEYPLFAVSWVKTWEWGLDGGLEAGFEGINNLDGIGSIVKGDLQQSTKTGHRMLYQAGHPLIYQYYTAAEEESGGKVYGIVGSFYCDKTQRVFSLVTMNSTTNEPSTEKALEDFEEYIESFICHS